MTISICDDMLSDRVRLSGYLRAYFEARGEAPPRVAGFASAEELLSDFDQGKYQVVFMDIYLGGTDGMTAARRIREKDPNCAIVFITTSADYAIDSYTVHAADYLLKPFGQREVCDAMDWCMAEYFEKNRSIEVISGRERRRVLTGDILYIEVMGRESVIHTQSERVSTNRSLGDLEATLDDVSFLRCHRSFLVNMKYIVRPDKNDFIIKNGDRVPIGTDNLTRIKQRYYDWSFNAIWKDR